jgi:SAM-dependent methyltransferase
MNYFAPRTAAERYSKGRPFFQPLLIGRAREFLSLSQPLPRGLDVCCGTGLSSVALKEAAARVVGVDGSEQMLAFAPRDSGITFCLADAESLPFGAGAFDIMSVCQALHWLDKRRLLAEARRVLRADGWLVVYDNYMTGRMAENEDFRTWFKETYIGRFPAPPRDRVSFAHGEPEGEGFRLLLDERFENEISFSPGGLIDFLTTHSNVIAAVEGGSDDINEVRAWLFENIRPFFGGRGEARFVFEAALWCLQRAASEPGPE